MSFDLSREGVEKRMRRRKVASTLGVLLVALDLFLVGCAFYAGMWEDEWAKGCFLLLCAGGVFKQAMAFFKTSGGIGYV